MINSKTKRTIRVPEEMEPYLLEALVLHGFTIKPLLDPVEIEALYPDRDMERLTKDYTEMHWEILYCSPPGISPGIGYYDASGRRLRVDYDDQTHDEALHHLFLALSSLGLRKTPFRKR